MLSHHPHTTQISRSYSHFPNATGRKNVHKENQNALPSKTPLRAPLGAKEGFATVGRTALGVKTDGRDRNALEKQLGGGKDKGKGKDEQDIGPKRLFQSTTKTHVGPSKSISSFAAIPPLTISKSRPVGKTPGGPPPTARKALRTPAAPQQTAPPPIDPVSTTPLPSMQRHRRSRSRQSLSSIANLTPSASAASFSTPVARQWEEENSLGSIHEGLEGLDNAEVTEKLGEEEVDGEVEYMPPKVQELPYEPAFELPDTAEVLQQLMAMPLSIGSGQLRHVPELEPEMELDARPKIRTDEELEEPLFRNVIKSAPLKPLTQRSGAAASKVSFARPSATVRPVGTKPSTLTQTRTSKIGPAARPALSRPANTPRAAPGASLPPSKRNDAPPKPADLLAPELDEMDLDVGGFELDLSFE